MRRELGCPTRWRRVWLFGFWFVRSRSVFIRSSSPVSRPSPSSNIRCLASHFSCFGLALLLTMCRTHLPLPHISISRAEIAKRLILCSRSNNAVEGAVLVTVLFCLGKKKGGGRVAPVSPKFSRLPIPLISNSDPPPQPPILPHRVVGPEWPFGKDRPTFSIDCNCGMVRGSWQEL